MKTSKSCHLWIEKFATLESLLPTEREAFNAHIASCPNCAATINEYSILTTRIQALPTVKSLTQTTPTFLWQEVQVKRLQSKDMAHCWRLFPLRFPVPFAKNNNIQGVLLVILCIVVISLTVFYSLRLQSASNGSNVYDTTLSTAKNLSSLCIVLSVNQHNTCTNRFVGSIHNTTSHLTSTMFLFIQEDQRTIRGYCRVYSPLIKSGSLLGSITVDKHIEFTIYDSQSVLTFHFTGAIYSDGSINGTYTTSDSQTGDWNARPL
jgi:hypothetical protein